MLVDEPQPGQPRTQFLDRIKMNDSIWIAANSQGQRVDFERWFCIDKHCPTSFWRLHEEPVTKNKHTDHKKKTQHCSDQDKTKTFLT